MKRKMVLREERSKKKLEPKQLFGVLLVVALLLACILLFRAPTLKAGTTEYEVESPDATLIWVAEESASNTFFFRGDGTTLRVSDNDYSLAASAFTESKWKLATASSDDASYFIYTEIAKDEGKTCVYLTEEDGKLSAQPLDAAAVEESAGRFQFFIKGAPELNPATDNASLFVLYANLVHATPDEPSEEDGAAVAEDEAEEPSESIKFVLVSAETGLAFDNSELIGTEVTLKSEYQERSFSLLELLRQQGVALLYKLLLGATILIALLSLLPVFFRRCESLKTHVMTISLAVVDVVLALLLYMVFKTNLCVEYHAEPQMLPLYFVLLALPVVTIVLQMLVKRPCAE